MPTPSASPRAATVPHVLDDAGLLSRPEAAAIEQRLARLETEPRRRLVVVTMKSLDGRSVDAVVEELGNRWNMGDGAILLIALRERAVRLAVARGSIGLISNADAQRIVDQAMLPDLRKNRFGPAIARGVDRIAAELSETMV